jgi:spermidine synthase
MGSTPPVSTASEPLAGRIALNTVVLVAGAALMSLEILGSRVLAPSYGSSVYVWGSLISTFLTALALGYALGGYVADRRPIVAALSVVLALAAVLILPCIVWSTWLLETVGKFGWDTRWATLLVAGVLFLPPSLAMGMVTPFAVRVGIRHVESAGSVSGGYAALSTLGSIAGTLLTTFFLIPRVAVGSMLLGLAGALILCALLLVRDRISASVAALAGLTCSRAAVSLAPPPNVSGETVLVRRDTAYHHILVVQLDTTRWFRFDNLTQSAVNLARPDASVLGYDEALLLALAVRPGIRRVCIIGLGGGWIPRALARIRPDIEVDTVEIDPAVREIATEYFLYRESARVRTVIEDGRVFLSRPGPAYDLIILDAYNSTGVPFHLTTKEFFEALRRRLTPDGVFAANVIGSLMGKDGKLFWAMYKTIHRQFGQVYVTSADLAAGRGVGQGNLILFATISADPVDREMLRRNAAELSSKARLPRIAGAMDGWTHSPDPPAGLPELTDAYAPIEALQHF